jgi:hypothetical protein
MRMSTGELQHSRRTPTGTLCIVGQHIWIGVTALHRVRGGDGDYRDPLTENTIKKNGLKWSNISVKKYHQSPGLGVRSGSRNLSQKSTRMRKVEGRVTLLPKYSAPIPSLR